MADQLQLQIQTTRESVQSAGEAASRWLADRGVPVNVQYFANLAIEEFSTNCIKYGYDDAQLHWLEVSLSLGEEALALTIVDDGRPFNPLEAPAPDLTLAVDERPIGGLGIYLVRRMADRMEYARQGDKNRLTLHKFLAPHDGACLHPKTC